MIVKRTYSSRAKSSVPSQSTSKSALPTFPEKRSNKHPLQDHPDFRNAPPPKRRKILKPTCATSTKGSKQIHFTQLHFCIDQTILRSCPSCKLSYTKGAPDDEMLHRVHCARVQKGMEWGREEEKEKEKGRIICFPADVAGKIGAKISSLIQTINLALSAPPLPLDMLRDSKVYLFLLPQKNSLRETIVGCAIAHRISTAMAIATPDRISCSNDSLEAIQKQLVTLDAASGLFCYPEPLPTPMGIPRIFVSASHRRQGIASDLLTAAAKTFIHGCPLNPRMGQVAFTQPTGDGNALMHDWGGNKVRIYEE
ncbi:hypothetical protein BDQ17DRAFT_557501 [Cyathus striatus]|nr:hypothetical protein BDQ17DRAFT_557501 [Cyathus striatus]